MGGTSSQETGSVDISDDRLQEKSVFGSLWFWMVGGLLAVALPIGLMAWSSAIWSHRDASLLGEKQEDFKVFVPPEPVKASPKKRSLWSAQAAWTQEAQRSSFDKELQSLTTEITAAGESMNSADFWAKVQGLTDGKDLPRYQKVIDRLASYPVDSYSTIENTVGSDWSVVGFYQDTNDLGVLVRYFFEPLSSNSVTNRSDDWIGHCQSILSFDEFAQSANGLFLEKTVTPEPDLIPNKQPSADDSAFYHFTPRFGYMVLIIKPDSNGVTCTDVVSIPGEVRMSTVGADGHPKIQDFFGEYQSVSDRSIARTLFLGLDQESTNTTFDPRRVIKTISSDRARMLAEIAEASLQDPDSMSFRMTKFQREFPDDFGDDALLVSLWFSHHQDKKMSTSFDDFGRFFVEAAHRLYMRTNDPLLLDVKSRIYYAYGKRLESDKCLQDLEGSNFKSLNLLFRRIEEAKNARDKEQLLNYLTQLNELLQQKPALASNRALRSKWNRQWLDWRTESQTN
ncbi:MAG: hypothetical protein ACKO8U_21505 [Pirellula sp.]